MKRLKRLTRAGRKPAVYCACDAVLDSGWHLPGEVKIDICVHRNSSKELFEFLVDEACRMKSMPQSMDELIEPTIDEVIAGSAVHTVRMVHCWLKISKDWKCTADDVVAKMLEEVKARTGVAYLPGGGMAGDFF